MIQLLGEGRLKEVVELGTARIASRPASCLPYLLTVKAASGMGRLPRLSDELRRMLNEHPDDPYLLAGSGFARMELREEDEALRLLTLAVRRGVACSQAYKEFVLLSQKLGRLRDAEATLEQLEADRPADPFVLFGRAFLWLRRGDGERALVGFQDALLKAPRLAMTCRHYARLLTAMGQFERAVSVCRAGLGVSGGTDDPETVADLWMSMGTALARLDRTLESAHAFGEALKIARDYRVADVEAAVLLNRSLLANSLGDSDTAARYLAWARSCGDRISMPHDEAAYLTHLGAVLSSIGEDDLAEATYRESRELARSGNDPFLELEAQVHLGLLLLGKGEIQTARREFSGAIDRTVGLEAPDLQVQALSGLAATYERVGDYESALRRYQRSVGLAEAMGDRQALATALANVGLIYFRMGYSPQAVVYTAQAAQLARDLNNLRLEVGVRQGLAAALAGLGNLRQSEQVYEETSAIASKLSSPRLQALVLAGWARVSLELGRFREAETRFQKALALARSGGNTLASLQSLAGLGLSAWRQGNLEEATERFGEAVEMIESFRQQIQDTSERIAYLETRARIYAGLAAVLVERGRGEPGDGFSERAFEVVERSRSRALLDMMSRSAVRLEGPQNRPARERRAGQSVAVSLLRSRVLRDGELLVEYSLGEAESTLWLVSRDEFRVIGLPARREIEQKVRSFLETVGNPPLAPTNPFERHITLGSDLFDLLLGPVRERVLESPHLIVAADGILHYLPFGALVVKEADHTSYLMEKVSLCYVPSASVLRELRQRIQANRDRLEFLGLAQPDPYQGGEGATAGGNAFSDGNIAAIPFAEEEVRFAAELFQADRRRVYVGSQATELAVKEEALDRYRIVHFAAHARADAMFPERSAIFLARDEYSREDGLLQMQEVLSLRLASDLIVLSGCQTGLGRFFGGEGALGLPWAFLSAGSSSVVVSLWSVNDRSTAELMRAFYQHLHRGESRGLALARASQELLASERKAFRHPYFWAAFILVGLAE